MRKICILFLLLGIISCSDNQRNSFDVIVEDAKPLQAKMYLSADKTLNVYYDLAVFDSCIAFTDYFSDSLLQIRSIANPLHCIKILYKGNGPYEYVSPYFEKSISEKNKKLTFLDVNSRKIATILSHAGQLIVEEENIPAGFPLCSSLNKMEESIYGVDMEFDNKGMFFIWDDKDTRLMKRISYYPEIKNEYKESSFPFLYQCDICVNESENTVVAAMLNMNLIHFYDSKGNLRKTCMIGDKLLYPDADSKYLDFPDANKYFVHVCGSEKYVYCLYNGTNKRNGASEIFVFDWTGRFIERYRMDKPLHRITADYSGRYLFGISENEEGGTDVLKITMPVFLF